MFDFYAIQSFPGLADDYSATCFAQSMMLEDGYGASTLGDFNTALTVLLLTKLSKERVYYGFSANGSLKHTIRGRNGYETFQKLYVDSAGTILKSICWMR